MAVGLVSLAGVLTVTLQLFAAEARARAVWGALRAATGVRPLLRVIEGQDHASSEERAL